MNILFDEDYSTNLIKTEQKEIENWINDSNRRMNAKDVAIFYAKKFELTFIMNIWKRHFYELITKKAK